MPQTSATRLGLAGGVCTLLGVGLARFAYTPLIPALVEADWFSPHAAAYLGAINLLGYLIGAATAHRATLVWGVHTVLAACLAITVASLYACALEWGVLWYGFWRLACGITGAMLVVVGVPAALSRVPLKARAYTSSLVFTGIGLGIMASGTVVPWLAGVGVAVTWLALALVASVLAGWAWLAVLGRLPPLERSTREDHIDARLPTLALCLVIAAYSLDAMGFVPHTLFWVDYIARELGEGLATGSGYWVVFGLGAMCGPVVAGTLAARLRFQPSLALALTVKTIAVCLPVLSTDWPALALSSFLVGMLVPGVVTLTSGTLSTLVAPERQQQVWGWATLGFALTQAVAAYGMSWGYEQLGSYRPLFTIAAVALAMASISAIAAVRQASR
ncbi:YbfB/YjiJ family MFS transporter [Salinisphaera sp.]|uniref:YbfB/YjiJ family MFS transporter n=1 Tax=Salinisphaera sp. TaxID=1914330 RepID=UPI000C58B2B2|nr:YbfB/YjiJ family MFS transporter [Salinisphaera sp.]MBS62117.1 MFS transporter [Salinisphaera sp.]